MSTLARIQGDFMRSLFEERAADARLEIYRRNVLATLHDALAAAYPVVQRLVGTGFFREAAERFARAVPSRSGDLHLFGGGFAAFLADYPHARSLPWLADVARLEWACHESHYAADAAAFDFAALARVPAERHGEIRFALHPSVRLVRSDHPVVAIWEANQADRDGTPERDAGPDYAVVHRESGAARPRRIERGEWEFLERLAAGATLAAASEAPGDEEAARFLAAALARYVAAGIISGFAAPDAA